MYVYDSSITQVWAHLGVLDKYGAVLGKNLQPATSRTAIAKLRKAVENFKNGNVQERAYKRKIKNASESFNDSKQSRTSHSENFCFKIPNIPASDTNKNDGDSLLERWEPVMLISTSYFGSTIGRH